MSRKKSNQLKKYPEFGQRFTETVMRDPVTGKERTAKTVANRLRVSEPSVSNWRRGFFLPDGESLIAIIQEFDVSADYLLVGRLITKDLMTGLISDLVPELHIQILEEGGKVREKSDQRMNMELAWFFYDLLKLIADSDNLSNRRNLRLLRSTISGMQQDKLDATLEEFNRSLLCDSSESKED